MADVCGAMLAEDFKDGFDHFGGVAIEIESCELL